MQQSIPRRYRAVALLCTAISAVDARVLVAQGASTDPRLAPESPAASRTPSAPRS